MANPSRLTAGLATVPATKPLGMYPFPDPFHTSGNPNFGTFSYVNDYTDIGTTTLNTITGTSSTFSLTTGVGGVALITPGGASTVTTVSRAFPSFQFVAGQKFWYLTRLQTSGVGAGVITRFGLQVGTGANTTNDSIYFTKVTGASGGINLVSTVSTVATTLVTGVVAATTAATYVDVGFYFDGTDLLVYASDVVVARIAGATIGSSGTTLSNGVMNIFNQITPVATETMSIDYVLSAQELAR